MRIATTAEELRQWSRQARRAGQTVGFVPTMGALHAGHLSLVRAARERGDAVAASIFVNPTQFAPNEDFDRYPRTLDADCALLEAEGVAMLFAPEPREMYRPGAATFVEVEGLSDQLDGASRPGHFRGVATVVAKLLLAAEPDRAYFGQKDAVQVAVLRRMVADLMLPVELVVCPIVRDADGLALSSRNRYLSPQQRVDALALSCALRLGLSLFAQGERSGAVLAAAMKQSMIASGRVRLDYAVVVDWATLAPVERVEAGNLIAVAGWVGATRLIDNAIPGRDSGKM